MDLTPKQQTSEAVRQAETILITTGQHPSVDQVSAVIALAAILRKFGKKVSAVVSDTLPQAVQLLDVAALERNLGGLRDFILKVDVAKTQVDSVRLGEVVDGKLPIFVTPFKGGFAPSDVTFDYGEANFDYDLAIVLGVPTRARIDRVYEQNQALFARIPVINLDFHRSNENYGAVNLIEPNASSLCEMLVALAESLQSGIVDDQIATALLMGIMGSTDRFTASHTTPKSLTVAAQMMAAGAKQQAVVRALYREGGRGEQGRGERERPQGGERNHAQREPRVVGGSVPQAGAAASAPSLRRPEPQAPQQSLARPQPQAAPVAAVPQAATAPAVSGSPAAPVAPSAAMPAPAVTPALVAAPSGPAQPVASARPAVNQPPDMRPFRVADGGDALIIDPSHIELSEPTEPQAPAPPAGSMADFAAAAEVLPPTPQSGQPRSERQ